MTRQTFLRILALSQTLALSYAMKDCMEPLRLSRAEDRPTCSIDFAVAPKTICDNGDTSTAHPDCKNKHSEGSDVCAFVVEAIFAEWRMLDGAFLTSGTCHAPIEEGRFVAQDALRVLPDNYELVGIQIQGGALKRALEQGLVDYFVRGNPNAYPHTAGLRYKLDLLQPEGHRIQNLKLLGFMCDWKPMDDNATYMILTDSHIASTIFANDAKRSSGTGAGAAEHLFGYATSVCTLYDNWHQMRLRHQPTKIPLDTESLHKAAADVPEGTKHHTSAATA